MTVTLRPSAARGHADHGWLDSRHTFSFAHYFDPEQMGFRALRVINEDVIAPGTGFGPHGHHDMEIITYVTAGALEHRDSTGGHSVIRPGEVQRMSAGTGVRHSEVNASREEPVRLLQIWIVPAREGLAPGYEQALFPPDGKRNRLCPIAAPGGRDGALTLGQDATVYASLLDAGVRQELPLAAGRGAWIQLISGRAMVNGGELADGDGAAVEDVGTVTLEALAESELLVFDLP
ncbi:MAG: pirin family protein [Telmatospirillum sp.]|nr:pirin family protein [Telmatospirillum sp.]